MGFIVGILGMLVAIGLLIGIHEFGHFLAARLVGVRVERLSWGFGPPLLRWKPGPTEYVISAVPIGGYVKMAGDEPQAGYTPTPEEFYGQPPGRRAIIIVAGVVMNAVLALVCFTVAFQLGVGFPKAEVGYVTPGGPAEEAGLQVGDEIVAVGNWGDVDYPDVLQLIALSDPAKGVRLTVLRDGVERTVQLYPRYSPALGRPAPSFDPPMSLTIGKLMVGFPAEAAGLQPGDRILAADGVPMSSFRHLQETTQASGGRPMAVTVERDGEELTFTLTPQPTYTYRLGARPADGPARVNEVLDLSPAEGAGVAPGDLVVAVGGRGVDGWSELIAALSQAQAGPLEVTVERGDRQEALTVVVPESEQDWLHRIGVLGQRPLVGEADPGGAAERAGLRPGMLITKIGVSEDKLQTLHYWEELELVAGSLHGRPLLLQCVSEEGTSLLTLTPQRGEAAGRYLIGIEPKHKQRLRKVGFFGACRLGWNKSLLTGLSVYLTLRRLILTHTLSGRELLGPISIGYITYKVAAEAGLSKLLYILGIIGINLSLVNLLPIPILDGGHLMVIAIEKVKGSRVSPRALALAQYVGLALIIGLFLFLTYNDITRHLTRFLGG